MTEELAWAAGFYDGEGCTHLSSGYLATTIGQVDREVLDKFAQAVGVGEVYGPYLRQQANCQPIFTYVAQSHDAQAVIDLIWPWLGSVKQAQALEMIAKAKVARPAGFCHSGRHKMSDNRAGTENRCRLCRNERANRRYHERRTNT